MEIHNFSFILVYFLYGLAFFSMGQAIFLEQAQCSDERLRHALRPLGVFGVLHGMHEWMEMFDRIGVLEPNLLYLVLWEWARLSMLAFSFLSLAAFGASLLSPDERARRTSLLLPLLMAAVWSVGLLSMRGSYEFAALLNVTDVWTRYTLAIPASVVAAAGLVNQQRRFRQVGLAQFGRDSLWAAVSFFWYGVVGQAFTRASLLFPSNILNQDVFYDVFGFQVQILRAGAALVAAFFVIRFLRSFEVERRAQISALQAARLEEAEQRQALSGQLYRRVVDAQEAERQRVARELHDETGQALTAIGLGLRGVSAMLNQDKEVAAQNLRQLEGLVDQSLTELQRLIADLRPSHLDDLGLPATLRWYASEVQKRTGLQVHVEISGEPHALLREVNTALFRIVQEALTNTVKHARARSAQVRLIFEPTTVTVRIQDDGLGFDAGRISRQGRRPWGLEGMRERAGLLGGTLELDSIPGLGTTISVTIPNAPPLAQEEEYENPVAAG